MKLLTQNCEFKLNQEFGNGGNLSETLEQHFASGRIINNVQGTFLHNLQQLYLEIFIDFPLKPRLCNANLFSLSLPSFYMNYSFCRLFLEKGKLSSFQLVVKISLRTLKVKKTPTWWCSGDQQVGKVKEVWIKYLMST